MIQATGKQIVHLLEMVTAKQLLHTLETLADSGYWTDSVQRTSELVFGSADYIVIYHPASTLGRLAGDE